MAKLVGTMFTTIIEAIIGATLLVTPAFTSAFDASQYTGLLAVIMPFVPVLAGLLVFYDIYRKLKM